MAMQSYKPVNALLRGLDVLATVNKRGGAASVGEIHQQTGIDKATIVRMLETLIHAGFIVRDAEKRIYEVTGKTLLLASGYDRHRTVARLVAPIMMQFRAEIGWPSDAAIFDQDAMLIIETSRETGPLHVNRHPGYRAPILATSIGRAYLAFCSNDLRDAVMTKEALDVASWNDIARNSHLAGKIFDGIRRKGYATMDAEYSRLEYDNKISSIGVPIIANGKVQASINVIYLKNALTAKKAAETLLLPLQKTAQLMANELALQPN